MLSSWTLKYRMQAEEKVLKAPVEFANYVGTTQWGLQEESTLTDEQEAQIWTYDPEESSLIQFPATGEPKMNIYTFAVYRPFVLSDELKASLELDNDESLDIKISTTVLIYNGIKIVGAKFTNDDGEDKQNIAYQTGDNI